MQSSPLEEAMHVQNAVKLLGLARGAFMALGEDTARLDALVDDFITRRVPK